MSCGKFNSNCLNRAIWAGGFAPASRMLRPVAGLFPAKRHHDFFVAASEDYPAIFDSLDRDLIDLSANLKTKLLAFAHRFAVDDGKAGGAIERNGADDECAGWNFTLIASAAGNFSGWLPANRPKRTAGPGIDLE